MISIEFNNDIKAYLNQCQYNLKKQNKDTFLNKSVVLKTQASVQKMMAKAGFHEFRGEPKTWPSLFISTQSFKNNLYYKTIPLKSSAEHHVEVSSMMFEANKLFNLLSIVDDPDLALNDSMVLRALDQPLNTRVLMKDKEIWMMNVPSESMTIDPIANLVSKKVLTFGLGIGYFVFMALQNKNVETIDIVENDMRVIEYFNAIIKPYFPHQEKITIHHGNALDWMSKDLSTYDHLFIDTYQNDEDGLYWWLQGCERIKGLSYSQVHYWIESSITSIMRQCILDVLLNQHHQYQGLVQRCMLKTRAYFNMNDIHIESVEACKKLLYNHELYRKIAATPLSNDFVSNKSKKHKSNP
jgi:hypothetical protein